MSDPGGRDGPQRDRRGGPMFAEILFSFGLAALGVYVLWHGSTFGRQLGYTVVGPAAFPIGIGAGLIAIGAGMALSTWRKGTDDPVAVAWRPFLTTLGLFAAYLLLLGLVGFLVATPPFLVAVARGLDSRAPLRDLTVGIVLTGVVFVGFRYGLGVRMPVGEFWDLVSVPRS